MPPDDTTRWILIGAAIAAAFYLIVLRPKLRKKRRGMDALDRPSEQGALSRQRGVEREMSGILVELTDMTRQVSAQLDTRAARLEVLIQQADQRIAMLEALNHRHGAERNTPPPLGISSGGSFNAGFAASADLEATATSSAPIDPRHAEVYALADQGSSPPEIAARLGRPNGEIQLILALRSRG